MEENIRQEDLDEFSRISPYTDAEAVEAFRKLAAHPAASFISQYLFPDESPDYLQETLRSINSIEEYQQIIMNKAINWVLDNTAHNFSYDGINHLQDIEGKYLLMSNHRDIILDPAITQMVLYRNGLPMTEVAVGDNLLSSDVVEYLLRSNRMITVIRGISARELYNSSMVLSKYIRHSITSGKSSVWLAQRQGRTKDGSDTTEQGLLKMLDLSGEGSFQENFRELNIVPLSISYEFEPCDILKAREKLISRTRKYVKGPKEDLNSILVGLRQQKGNIHLNIGTPLTPVEIEAAAQCDKNDRYQFIRRAVDVRVIRGYRLWHNNYIASDMVNRSYKYSDIYTHEEVEVFTDYMEKQLDSVEDNLNREDLREIFLRIYANPVANKEHITFELLGGYDPV